MTIPRVTVIIPAWRAARTIRRAVDSLLAQTRPPDEILVIDDGSPDDIAVSLKCFGERVTLLRQLNGGAASARNHGLERASGELLAFLDADDYWEPHKLERQLDVLERHPEVGLTAARNYDEHPGMPRIPPSQPAAAFFDRVVRATDSDVDVLDVARKAWTSTVVVRRAALGGRRFDLGLKTAEDVDLWIRVVLEQPVYLLSEPLATCVLEPGSLSRSDVAGDSRNMLAVVHRYAAALGPDRTRAWEALVYRDWAAGYLGQGEPRAALPPAWNRVARQPWSLEGLWILVKSACWSCSPRLTRRLLA
jgi:glycosyltransferase involved in cell wall biosynthesis